MRICHFCNNKKLKLRRTCWVPEIYSLGKGTLYIHVYLTPSKANTNMKLNIEIYLIPPARLDFRDCGKEREKVLFIDSYKLNGAALGSICYLEF